MKPDHRWAGFCLAMAFVAEGCSPRAGAEGDPVPAIAIEVGVAASGPPCGGPVVCPLPDCDSPDNPTERVWCASIVPDPLIELPRMRAALTRMTARGGICGPLAATIASLLAGGAVRVYDSEDFPAVGAAAPVDGGRAYLLLSRALVMKYFDAAHRSANVDSRGAPRPETLQLVLAHEADHLRGLGHIDPDGFLTPNALPCSDLR
jgi:hypothetical protein